MTLDPVPRLRTIALSLPEVTEKLSHGSPCFFVKKCFLMCMRFHHGDARDAIWVAAPPGAQEELVAAEPERFFRPPYVGHRGWLGLDLAATGLDWDEVAEIVTDGWRTVAPKRLL